MSKLFQPAAAGVSVTAFSAPAEMIDTISVATSGVQTSTCSRFIAVTSIGDPEKSMP